MSSTEMLLNPEVTFDEQLEVFLAFAKSLAHQASQMIRDGQADRFAADSNSSSENENVEKLSSVDLVTQVDKSVEDFLMSSIAQAYPTHKFVGEEMVSAGEKEELTDEWTWIIDPIDGTMNFVHSFNAVGCSIGLTYKKEPVVGVIAMPFANQVYSARKGAGAFLNNTIPLPLTGGRPQVLEGLKQCLISAEWGSVRSPATMGPKIRSFNLLAGDVPGGLMCHGLRSCGATTIALIQVATGQLDIYWDAAFHSWDVCAGMVILQESGGAFFGGIDSFKRGTDTVGELLMGRRCAAVRALAVPKGKKGTTAKEHQKSLVKELYDIVEEWPFA